MRVLVTGADGYIGAHMTYVLEEHGYDVIGVDTCFFASGLLYPLLSDRRILPMDVRDLDTEFLSRFDAVVHLGELSNDPLGELDPGLTMALNHRGSVELATRCRDAGVSRFLYSSSCSVYGAGGDFRSEDDPLDPRTAYALCKTLVERDVAPLASDTFAPVFFRNATAYGLSPRMRFDLVLNNLSALAYLTGVVQMTSDGSPWRPLIHARDICMAFAAGLDAPVSRIRGQILNTGNNDENYRIRDIATVVGRVFESGRITFGAHDADDRSYRVSFDRIQSVLPGFSCSMDIEQGAFELRDGFRAIGLSDAMFRESAFTRAHHLRMLLDSGRLDRTLRWRAP